LAEYIKFRRENFPFLEHAGHLLRARREIMGLTLRDVEMASARLAEAHRNEEFLLPLSRISEIESKGVVPTVYKFYALAVIYRVDLIELLRWYAFPLEHFQRDAAVTEPPKSHISGVAPMGAMNVPVYFDPSFDPERTSNFGRMVERWGVVPLSFLSKFAEEMYTYGYIGMQDYTMYPMILPGSFVQIDEGKKQVEDGGWRSEYERPIYFVETRDGFMCSWCSMQDNQLIVQPHPLSGITPRIFKYPQNAEVLGQVVGIAMRLTAPKVKEAAPAQRQLSVAQ
jgi:transcriptional regulator with XRE-family HTH domain